MKALTDMSREELLQLLTEREAMTAEKFVNLEDHYRSLFCDMNIAFAQHEIICDESGTPRDYRFLCANRCFMEETGIRDPEGKTVRELLPDIEEWWIETYGKVALTGEPVRFEHYGRSTGKHYDVSAFSTERGKFSVLVKDITERKRAEEALRESEAQYSAIVSAFDGLLYVCSSDYRIEFQNEAMKRRTGRDAVGELCYQALQGRDAICPWCVSEEVFAGESVRWTTNSPLDDRWYEVINTPIHRADGTVSKQAMVIDITERKELEAALFQNKQELELANQLLEQRVRERTAELEAAIRAQESFSYTVSHDLRAPLRHMNSFSALMVEDFGEALPPQARHYLDRIRSASGKMGALIDHLLELSRVTRAQLILDSVDLTELAESTMSMFRETDPHRNVKQAIEPGLKALGDEALLRQLLENLLGNAWKYTAKRPCGSIRFGRGRVDTEEVFFVEDNGTGFDMVYQDKLFRPFERLHGSDFEGEGIGLATARHIVQRHGGRIWCEGRVGQGASFYFTLPPAAPPQ